MLKIRDLQKSGGTYKRSKSCEPLQKYSTDLGSSIVVPPIASIARQVVFPRHLCHRCVENHLRAEGVVL